MWLFAVILGFLTVGVTSVFQFTETGWGLPFKVQQASHDSTSLDPRLNIPNPAAGTQIGGEFELQDLDKIIKSDLIDTISIINDLCERGSHVVLPTHMVDETSQHPIRIIRDDNRHTDRFPWTIFCSKWIDAWKLHLETPETSTL